MNAVPDTPLVREASALASATLTQAVLDHSRRSFLLGRGYAARRAVAFDEEGLFLCALFHDFGLADERRDVTRAFTEVSASRLQAFLDERGDSRGEALAEAIELHMQLLPRWSRGPEAALLQIGAWMDVTGLRASAVGRPFVREVEALAPRGSFDAEFRRRLIGSLGSPRACFRLLFPRARATHPTGSLAR